MGLGLVGLRYGIRMIRNGEGAQGGTETTDESEAGGRGEAETGGDSEGGSTKTREVQEGDTLWEINDDFGEPMTWESIAEVNDIEEPERVSEETEDDTDAD
jgi:nucleoid-associated protein YgaU